VKLPDDTHAALLRWSPDGQRLAYLLNEGSDPGLDVSITQSLRVWESGQAHEVTSLDGQAAMLHGWACGNEQVILETLDPANTQTIIALIDVETGESQPVAVPEMARIVGCLAD